MREDYQENLEKMFPKGFVILYVQPNTDPAYCWYNPLQDEFITDYLMAMDALLKSNDLIEGDDDDHE